MPWVKIDNQHVFNGISWFYASFVIGASTYFVESYNTNSTIFFILSRWLSKGATNETLSYKGALGMWDKVMRCTRVATDASSDLTEAEKQVRALSVVFYIFLHCYTFDLCTHRLSILFASLQVIKQISEKCLQAGLPVSLSSHVKDWKRGQNRGCITPYCYISRDDVGAH